MILAKYNQAKTITFDLVAPDGVDLIINATFAAGDVVIMKDEGAEANTSNLPTDEGTGYSLVLTATEVSAARIRLYIIDQTATKIWLDISIGVETYGNASAEHAFDLDTANVTLAAATHTGAVIPTISTLTSHTPQTGDNFARLGAPAGASVSADVAAVKTDTAEIGTAGAGLTNIGTIATVTTLTNKTGFSLAATGLDAISQAALGMVEIAKAVWDRLLQGNTHNINNSAGKRLREAAGIIFLSGTSQSGGNNSIQLEAGDVTLDDQYIKTKVITVGGTGAGQEAIVTSSLASTDTLTVTPAWLINPDATTEYEILPAQAHSTVRNGGYDDSSVYVDTVNGTAGTEQGVNATSTNPSSNLTDAYAIAAEETITKFVIKPGSNITLPSDSSDIQIIGASYNLALNGQNIDNSRFTGASVSGIATADSNNPPAFILCGIGTVTLPPSNGSECGFFGTFTLGSAGSYTYGGSGGVFDLPFIIDYGAALNASTFFLLSFIGGEVEIQNAGAGTGSYKFEMNGNGDLTVNANCSATTTVTLRGNISRNADVTGITYDETANVWQDTINAECDTALVDADITIDWANGGRLDLLLDQLVTQIDTAASEPGQTAPPVSAKMALKIDYLYKWSRNRSTSTATTISMYADDATTVDQKSTHSDDGTTYDRGEIATGP